MKYYNSNISNGGFLNINESMSDQLKRIKAPVIELDGNISPRDLKEWLKKFDDKICLATKKVVVKITDLMFQRGSSPDWFSSIKSEDIDKDTVELVHGLVETGRVREIPIFWSTEYFEESLEKPRPIDYYVYDLGTVEGRESTAKKFLPICKKIAISYAFKNAGTSTRNITDSDMYGAAAEGLTRALYNYGRSRDEYVRTGDNSWKADEDTEYKIVNTGSLPSYISWMVRNAILDYLNDEDKLVRIPRSENARVRRATGANITQSTTSGDDVIGSDDDARTKFDTMPDDNATSEKDTKNSDLKSIEDDIFKAVKNKFGEAVLKLWQEKYGLGGVEPRDKKKNPYGPNDYYRLKTIEKFVKTDKEVLKLLKDLYSD